MLASKMNTTSLRVALCNELPCELAHVIWQTYHTKYVLVEMMRVTKDQNQKYEELYDDYQNSIKKVIDVVDELLVSNSLVWNITMTNIEDNILLCEEVDEDLYRVFNIVNNLASHPSYLKIELSKLHLQSCHDLEKMIGICSTLQRMMS
jgi:hypothetical protein